MVLHPGTTVNASGLSLGILKLKYGQSRLTILLLWVTRVQLFLHLDKEKLWLRNFKWRDVT